MLERYLEVFGEGKFQEQASSFIAEVTLEIRAAEDETALQELQALSGEALASLRGGGIADDEIVGGGELNRPWYWKKPVGQTATRKIILKVADVGKLNRALAQLEPLQASHKERRTISIALRQPEYQSSREAQAGALVEAFEDALAKATRLAAAMNVELGRPIQTEEGGWAKRSSGVAGDADWGGDRSRFALGGAAAVGAPGAGDAEPERELFPPTRTIFVRCRVRFGIVEA